MNFQAVEILRKISDGSTDDINFPENLAKIVDSDIKKLSENPIQFDNANNNGIEIKEELENDFEIVEKNIDDENPHDQDFAKFLGSKENDKESEFKEKLKY